MASKQTSNDGMTKLAAYIALSVGVATTALLFIVGAAKTSVLLPLAIGVGAALLWALILLPAVSLMTTHRVACDSVACEVATRSKWRNHGSQRFRWDEVTATRVEHQVHQGYTREARTWDSIHLFVVASGNDIELLRKQNLNGDFSALVATVNQMTPQLPYIWVQPKAAKDLRVLLDGKYYCKVARSQT